VKLRIGGNVLISTGTFVLAGVAENIQHLNKVKKLGKMTKCCLDRTRTAGNVSDSKLHLQKRLIQVFCLKSIAYLLITKTTMCLKQYGIVFSMLN